MKGGRETSGVSEHPGGDWKGVGGGVKLPRGINTPGVEEFPWWDETSRVTPEGDRVLGEYGRGQGGDGNSSTTRETEANGNSGSDEEMTIDPGPAAGRGSEVRLYRHPNGADGARPKFASKYGLLAPTELAGDPASTELQEHGNVHDATTKTGGLDAREAETGHRNRQHVLLACGQMEEDNKEQRPP